MIWTITEKGRKMPVDFTPVETTALPGLFVLRRDGDSWESPKAIAVTPGFFDGHDEPAYVSHFATCPHADRHRRR